MEGHRSLDSDHYDRSPLLLAFNRKGSDHWIPIIFPLHSMQGNRSGWADQLLRTIHVSLIQCFVARGASSAALSRFNVSSIQCSVARRVSCFVDSIDGDSVSSLQCFVDSMFVDRGAPSAAFHVSSILFRRFFFDRTLSMIAYNPCFVDSMLRRFNGSSIQCTSILFLLFIFDRSQSKIAYDPCFVYSFLIVRNHNERSPWKGTDHWIPIYDCVRSMFRHFDRILVCKV